MLRIRPVTASDLSRLVALVTDAGGMTTLPRDEEGFTRRIAASEAAFSANARSGEGEVFFMVLEDTSSGQILGTTAIYTDLGAEQPFYNYRISTITHMSHELDIRHQARVLMLVNDYAGETEIGTLFMAPSARGRGAAHLLSRCRFLLMALDQSRFNRTVLAEMRGWVNEAGISPLWEALGKHFFHLPFDLADNISGNGNQFIADLMPKYPVYVDVLPKEAQDAIGRPHRNAEPAYGMLIREGLRFNNAVDIFDGGPVIDAPIDQLRTVRNARTVTVSAIAPVRSKTSWLVGSTNFAHFTCVQTPLALDGDMATIPADAAAALGVEPGQILIVTEA